VLSHTKPASATTRPLSARGQPSSTPCWRFEGPTIPSRTPNGEATDALEERHDGGAPGRNRAQPLRSPPSSNRRAAHPAVHRGGQPSGPPGDRGHPSPLREARDPSNTEMLGGPLFRPITKRNPSEAIDGDTLERVEHAILACQPGRNPPTPRRRRTTFSLTRKETIAASTTATHSHESSMPYPLTEASSNHETASLDIHRGE
jgi:hypothetical protein